MMREHSVDMNASGSDSPSLAATRMDSNIAKLRRDRIKEIE